VPILKIGDQKHRRCRELPCREIAAFCGCRPGRLRSLPGPTAATASGTKRRTCGLQVASVCVRPRSVRIRNVLRRPSEHTAVRTSGRPRVYAREQRPLQQPPNVVLRQAPGRFLARRSQRSHDRTAGHPTNSLLLLPAIRTIRSMAPLA
jgi:hypothetical protein